MIRDTHTWPVAGGTNEQAVGDVYWYNVVMGYIGTAEANEIKKMKDRIES